jgi:hypothetical protein
MMEDMGRCGLTCAHLAVAVVLLCVCLHVCLCVGLGSVRMYLHARTAVWQLTCLLCVSALHNLAHALHRFSDAGVCETSVCVLCCGCFRRIDAELLLLSSGVADSSS